MNKIILTVLGLLSCGQLLAAPPTYDTPKPLAKTAAGCNQTTAAIELDINNVRGRLMNGGDMWWNIGLGRAAYEVPKGSGHHSLFAGSIWIGGFEHSTNVLKVTAQTFRSRGNDYWSGPLDEFNGASIDFKTCSEWDRFWKINATDINDFKDIYTKCNGDLGCLQSADIVDVIKEWPGQASTDAIGSGGLPLSVPNREMAPFYDNNNDGKYNWRDGDYPNILGDQYIWWIINDKGDVKTNTQSEAIGLEIHVGAFAFSTNDCLNESTFYNYRVFNWNTTNLDSTYMATFTDADLGYAFDDFIGGDTARGLGILYNADPYDENAEGYGYEIPMVGVDFFRGPRFYDTALNKVVELEMTVFTYYNNSNGPTGDPQRVDDFYEYMTGTWRDGTCFKFGCDPHATSGQCNNVVFPDDPCGGGTVSEPACNNVGTDKRFIHSSGPFTLIPGNIPSDVTIGAIWVPEVGSGSSACFGKILICDNKVQDLFDNDFQLPFGPMAPVVYTQPMDKKIIFNLDNLAESNNYNEWFGRTDKGSQFYETSKKAVKQEFPDSTYHFEGYIVYQLKDGNTALSDIKRKDGSINEENARIVFQCDKKNGVSKIFNYVIDPDITNDYYQTQLMINGSDEGIRHSFEVTQDAFAQGQNKDLVNYKTYYYIAIAYGYNKFDNADADAEPNDFDPDNVDITQDIQYVESRTNGKQLPIDIIAVMPSPAYDSLYAQNYTDFGTGLQVKRLEGKGNGGNILQMTQASEDEVFTSGNNAVAFPIYLPNKGPVNVFVSNPDSIKEGNYEIYLDVKASNDAGADGDSTTWHIVNTTTGQTIYSSTVISEENEQYLRKYDVNGRTVIADWGLSVEINQVLRPGDDDSKNDNGLLSSDVIFADPNNQWLSGVRDQEDESKFNWIRSGNSDGPDNNQFFNSACKFDDYKDYDRYDDYEKVMNGTWAPYNLTAFDRNSVCGYGVIFNSSLLDRRIAHLNTVYSIDVVFTSDKNLWTRCPVIEMSDNDGQTSVAEGGAYKFNLREHASWDKQVDANGNPVYHPTEKGWSWFPGYVINVETGERLNLMFGEESVNGQDNGDDMIWNPTSRQLDPLKPSDIFWGGKHLIYVMNTKYDGGQAAIDAIRSAYNDIDNWRQTNAKLRIFYRESMMWVGNPVLAPGAQLLSLKDGIIPTHTRIQIRVTRPYDNYVPTSNQTLKNNGWPRYSFSTFGMAPVKYGEAGNNFTGNLDELLKRIQPVPNPYYAYAEYETDRIDTRVRIINLPAKATIKIYSLDGNLIKTLRKNDNISNYVDWDMKNSQNLPIASGMYLMHVNVDGIGETVLKWFGAMKPVDLTSF